MSNLIKNGRKFSKWVENTVGKEEIARYEQFLFSYSVFKKIVLNRYYKQIQKTKPESILYAGTLGNLSKEYG